MENITDVIVRNPGKPQPIYRQIVEQLRKKIVSSEIKPGERLPSISDMTKQLDVGYPTVRSALQILEKEGLLCLESSRGKGALVLDNQNIAKKCVFVFPRWCANKQFIEIAKGIKDYCQNFNIEVVIVDAFQNTERYQNLVTHPPQDAKGLILYPWDSPSYQKAINNAIDSGLKVVLVDRIIPALDVNSAAADHFVGAYEATKHLLEIHHRPVYYFGYTTCPSSARERYKGWLEAMHEYNYNMDYCDSYKWEINISEAETLLSKESTEYSQLHKAKAFELLKTRKETKCSIFCVNDDAAKSVYLAAEEVGLEIGKDIFVVGFGNMRFCELLPVPLTSVYQSDKKVGYEAARLLYDQVRGKQPHPIHLVIPTELKIRASSTGDIEH